MRILSGILYFLLLFFLLRFFLTQSYTVWGREEPSAQALHAFSKHVHGGHLCRAVFHIQIWPAIADGQSRMLMDRCSGV